MKVKHKMGILKRMGERYWECVMLGCYHVNFLLLCNRLSAPISDSLLRTRSPTLQGKHNKRSLSEYKARFNYLRSQIFPYQLSVNTGNFHKPWGLREGPSVLYHPTWYLQGEINRDIK